MPMIAPVHEYSIVDAIKTGWEAGKSASLQPNGDTVEIVDLEVRENQGVVVILFHRSSPDAADPMYRKREKKKFRCVKLIKTKMKSSRCPHISLLK